MNAIHGFKEKTLLTNNSLDKYSLEGERAIVTGGGSGIGLAIAEALATSGADVILMGRNETKLRKACGQLGQKARPAVFDVTDTDDAGASIRAIEQEHGPVSILVNNAGVHLKKPAESTGADEFRRVQETHVTGALVLSQEVARGMLERNHGSIVFIASMASYLGMPLVTAYAAAKTAQLGVMRSLAAEWSGRGVRVNAVAPGWISTDMMMKAVEGDPQRKRKILSRTPMGRFGEPCEIGWAVAFLCSEAASFINGVCLPVDGGALMGF